MSKGDVAAVAAMTRACRFLQDTWRDVPYDMATLLENVLDASHVPFTHHK
jgi:phenylpropionate dioxygenase-like ring-hydroxylating dioxygenase large terminal subunit